MNLDTSSLVQYRISIKLKLFLIQNEHQIEARLEREVSPELLDDNNNHGRFTH